MTTTSFLFQFINLPQKGTEERSPLPQRLLHRPQLLPRLPQQNKPQTISWCPSDRTEDTKVQGHRTHPPTAARTHAPLVDVCRPPSQNAHPPGCAQSLPCTHNPPLTRPRPPSGAQLGRGGGGELGASLTEGAQGGKPLGAPGPAPREIPSRRARVHTHRHTAPPPHPTGVHAGAEEREKPPRGGAQAGRYPLT